MSVAARIVLGCGLLVLVVLGVAAYQVSIIFQMESIGRELSEINFHASETIEAINQRVGDLEDNSRKYFALNGDPVYGTALGQLRTEFSSDLADLRLHATETRERQEVDLLAGFIDDYWRQIQLEETRSGPGNPDDGPPDLPRPVRAALVKVRAQVKATGLAIQASTLEKRSRASDAGARARTVSLVAGAGALFLSIVVAFLIVRAITEPLRRLTDGTRRIAKGQFWHRLPVDGSDEFSALSQDFNTMAQRLSELDQMKKDFVSHVSHDLKAPLASIRQVSLLLLQEIAGPLNDQQRKLIRLSTNSAERLSAMVGNLLDVSRLEAGSMEYDIRSHDMAAVIRGVIDEFEVQAADKRIQLRLECSGACWVLCDRERIVQVMGNLFENALKFTATEGTIVARFETAENERIKVIVADSGRGVPENHKQSIFEKFHQIREGGKIGGQGVGLGLAICKAIVEAHHGTIWVEDNSGGGSIFCFTLSSSAAKPVTEGDSARVRLS